MLLEIDWFFQHVDLVAPALHPGLHRRRRLADQLDRPDHAVLARCASTASPCPGMRQLSRVLPAQAPGGARDPAGRHRLAGHRARAGRQDGQHRGGQGDRQARDAEGVLPAARARPDRRAHRAGLRAGAAGDDRGASCEREHPPLWRDLPPRGQAGGHRPGPGPAAGRRTHGDRRDRRAHRPAARPEDHGDQPLPEEPGAGGADLPRLRPARAEPDGGLRVRLRLRARHPGRDRRPLVRPVVAAARARRDRRLDDQRPRHVADLRAAGAAPDPRHQGARAVPAPPGRGRRGLRADHRRRRDHPGEHRRLPARRPPRRPDPADAGRGDAAGHRQRGRAGARSGAGRRRQPSLRQHPRGRGPGGGRPHHRAVQGPGVQPHGRPRRSTP